MHKNKIPVGKSRSKPSHGVPLSESKSSLGSLLNEAGIILDERQLDLLWRFHLLLRRHTEEYDLTRLRSFRDIAVKHYIDCMIVPSLIELPSPLLDIGTGAGFPGIPLKIVCPECEIILAESRSNRVEFLEHAVKELGLKGIRIHEGGVLPGRMGEKVAGVITRALETAEKTLNRVKDNLDPGGQVILMKGPQGENEISEALHLWNDTFTLKKNISYTLPGTHHRRRLIIFEKISSRQTQGKEREEERTTVDITSVSNPSYKVWKSLLTGRGIKREGLALVSGAKVIAEICRLKHGIIRALILPPGEGPEPVSLPPEIPRYRLSGELFRELDVHGTDYPLLVVSIPETPSFESAEPQSGAILLVPFQDPANVGAVIRSAVAFGVRAVVLLREAATPFHPKSLRAAGTAAFLVDYYEGPSIRELSDIRLPVVALSAAGKPLSDFTFPDRFALLPGLEGPGLPEELKPEYTVSITMEKDVESLNAAVAASIVLFEWRRRFGQ
jgi:16S rRNA (guanine(527)-N(7))-methyltransferase RsmG